MLSIALYIGLCCHTAAPHLIKSGMTIEQVKAILGKEYFFTP